MPAAHYGIDSSRLESGMCSIFACQWGLWRGWDETKTSLNWCSWQLGIFPTTPLAGGQGVLFKAPRGTSAKTSSTPIFGPQQSPVVCSLPRENWLALVHFWSSRQVPTENPKHYLSSYLSFIPCLVLKYTQKTPSHSQQGPWSQGDIKVADQLLILLVPVEVRQRSDWYTFCSPKGRLLSSRPLLEQPLCGWKLLSIHFLNTSRLQFDYFRWSGDFV